MPAPSNEYKTLGEKVRATGALFGQFVQMAQEIEGGLRVLQAATADLEARLTVQQDLERRMEPLRSEVMSLEKRKASLEKSLAAVFAKFSEPELERI